MRSRARADEHRSARSVACSSPYAAQVAYYSTKFPGQPAVRKLVLALTDTFYRSFYETFRELAIEHGVYIAAAMNAAPARRVEAARGPCTWSTCCAIPTSRSRTYAYEAVSPYPGNTTYVFAPDGEVLGARRQGRDARKPRPRPAA